MAGGLTDPETGDQGLGSTLATVIPQAVIPQAVIPQTAAQSLPQSPAARACEVVISAIRKFESQLDRDDEVAMGFAGGEAGILRIEGLGYNPPDLVTFHGRGQDGRRMQIIQHVTQISVVLRAAPKAAPDGPAHRIGFRLTPVLHWAGGEAGDGSAWAAGSDRVTAPE